MLLILVNFCDTQPACIENAVIAVLTRSAYLWFSFKSLVKGELDSSVLKPTSRISKGFLCGRLFAEKWALLKKVLQ